MNLNFLIGVVAVVLLLEGYDCAGPQICTGIDPKAAVCRESPKYCSSNSDCTESPSDKCCAMGNGSCCTPLTAFKPVPVPAPATKTGTSSSTSSATTSTTTPPPPPDNPALTVERLFRLKNKKSGLYMSEIGDTREIQQLESVKGENRASQLWFLLPLGKDRYKITCRKTGLYLVGVGSYVFQKSLTFFPNESDTWIIRRDDTVVGEELYFIVNEATPILYLVISGYVITTGIAVVQAGFIAYERNSYQWVFEVEQEFPAYAECNQKVNRAAEDFGSIKRIISLQQPIPSKSEEVLIGQVSIPFQLIAETGFSLSNQSMLSPIYCLHRYGYWKAVVHHEYDGTPQITMTSNVKIGLITYNAMEIQRVTGLSVGMDWLSVWNSTLTKLIKDKIASGLKIGVAEEPVGESSTSMALERKFDSCSRQIGLVWFRENHYVLLRMNGDVALQWNVRDPISVNDDFPGGTCVAQKESAISSK